MTRIIFLLSSNDGPVFLLRVQVGLLLPPLLLGKAQAAYLLGGICSLQVGFINKCFEVFVVAQEDIHPHRRTRALRCISLRKRLRIWHHLPGQSIVNPEDCLLCFSGLIGVVD
jgi:hypothetical protein